MDQDEIIQYISQTFEGVTIASPDEGIAAGDTFFTYDERKLPFATIVTKDYGDFDCASNLNREGVFRFNVGVSKQTFTSLFPETQDVDYAALDQLLPHPVYAPQSWVCVLNPSQETFERLRPLLAEAYAITLNRH